MADEAESDRPRRRAAPPPLARIHVLSDLHLEFTQGHRFRPDGGWPEADVLVLAGDIGTGPMARSLIEERVRHGPVIYVLGNHEFYGHDLRWVRRYWHQLSDEWPNLHVLDGDLCGAGNDGRADLLGLRFLGTTLWSDTRGPPLLLNDYAQITGFDQRQAYARHISQTTWLARQIDEAERDQKPCVVVTHHLPSMQCIPDAFRDSAFNRAYASNLDALVTREPVRLWIHGHTHASRDFFIDKTRVVCNPRGYRCRREATGFENAGFDSRLCVAVSTATAR